MEAKVKACRALLGKSTGIRIGVTLKAFKEGQHSKFEHELDRMIQNEQVFMYQLVEYAMNNPSNMCSCQTQILIFTFSRRCIIYVRMLLVNG